MGHHTGNYSAMYSDEVQIRCACSQVETPRELQCFNVYYINTQVSEGIFRLLIKIQNTLIAEREEMLFNVLVRLNSSGKNLYTHVANS